VDLNQEFTLAVLLLNNNFYYYTKPKSARGLKKSYQQRSTLHSSSPLPFNDHIFFQFGSLQFEVTTGWSK